MALDDAPVGQRISEVRIEGARCIRKVSLSLGGLTVLIGPNGAGKSTIIEALELLRLLGAPLGLEQQLYRAHGGLAGLLRRGERSMRLGVSVRGGEGEASIDYDVRLTENAGGIAVTKERLLLGPRPGFSEPLRVIVREPGTEPHFFDQKSKQLTPIPNLPPTSLAIHAFGQFPPNAAITRLVAALRGIAVHVPFDVRAAWTTPSELPALRSSNVVRPVERLERFGSNLANVWHRLKNDFGARAWAAVMHDVRAGLGPDVEDVGTQADPSGGQVGLKVRFVDNTDIPAFSLSDGMLVYLSFVALRHLPDPHRSLLAFDEPEGHLHPELLTRVVGLLEEVAEQRPLLLATHSDRLLDVLQDPAASAVLCDLGPDRTTRLRRPDPKALQSWLEDYRGLGDLRSHGYDASVFSEAPGETPTEPEA